MKKILLLIICNLLLSVGFAQWQQANNGLFRGSVRATTIDPATNYLYAGTRGSGIFLSTNNGSTWTAVNNGLSNINVESIAISGTNIFAGTQSGVFKSTNNGSSWTAVNNGFSRDELSVKSLAINGSNIFAGTSSGVYLSTDSGGN
jgi:photosystem II stability/assembly factor-like uncharacterized protein